MHVDGQDGRRVPTRRSILTAGAGLVAVTLVPVRGRATPDDVATAIREAFGDRPVEEGRVTLKIPALSENGNSVPLTVTVDSPMTEQDHVTSIQVFAPKNPLPNVGKYFLGPRAGRAEIATRIRLADTQIIMALAEMSDGSVWSGAAETVVTIAACVDPGI